MTYCTTVAAPAVSGELSSTKAWQAKENAKTNIMERDRSQSCDSEIDYVYMVDQQTAMLNILIKLAKLQPLVQLM